MTTNSHDSFDVIRTLEVGGCEHRYFSLKAAEQAGLGPVRQPAGPEAAWVNRVCRSVAPPREHQGAS